MADHFDSHTAQRTDDLLRSWDETHSRLRKYSHRIALRSFFLLFSVGFFQCVVYDFITIHYRPPHHHAFI